ncbi:inorganic pyrophosphatase [Cokeromyces recurvatus]|uniref:inorganic pyrophosphatase n=1 Tax=Cokeromyces recurvatus TaxID=90255 RepID=UPI00221F3136|nr:inorganic pyrophosphatase [Cokeromyces recurvatus]KAI7906845.1 inorganic pyrophosphatase [Cokeromyces recurvatus]
MSTKDEYEVSTIGEEYTNEYRIFIEKNGKVISPFHDVPLFVDSEKKIVNMIVEVPRWSNAKFEIATNEPFNPIKQDVKKGKLRFVRNCFPFKGYIWNYGALPQTWENPTIISNDTNTRGDNDPIDVCEIGQEIGFKGQIKQVKILGILALLDEDETDWKLIAIDIKDPLSHKLNDIHDIEIYFPDLMKATRQWFKIYKIPDGKLANKFGFNGEFKNKDYAYKIIQETHESWKGLIEGRIPYKSDTHHINVMNVTIKNSPYKLLHDDDKKTIMIKHLKKQYKRKCHVKEKDDKWYFVAKSQL